MFKWLQLLGLRAKTIAVVEQEYGRRLEIAGGPDSPMFNSITRMIRDVGGNEYDAAAAFVATDAATRFRQGLADSPRPLRMAATTRRLVERMNCPELIDDIQDRLLEKCG